MRHQPASGSRRGGCEDVSDDIPAFVRHHGARCTLDGIAAGRSPCVAYDDRSRVTATDRPAQANGLDERFHGSLKPILRGSLGRLEQQKSAARPYLPSLVVPEIAHISRSSQLHNHPGSATYGSQP
jgi:hypothetical protein